MERYTLAVEGMSCDGCERRVENAARAVAGVRRVEADHETDTVEVAGDDGTEAAVREAIAEAGYEPA